MKHEADPTDPTANQNTALIISFIEITSSSEQEATFFLESHQWDLDATVSTFLDKNFTVAALQPIVPPLSTTVNNNSPARFQSDSPSRSRSPFPARPAYAFRSRRNADKKPSGDGSNARGIRTLADLNRTPSGGSDSNSDKAQVYFIGCEKSGMMVRDPSKNHDVDSIFNQAREARLLSGEVTILLVTFRNFQLRLSLLTRGIISNWTLD